MRKQILTAAVMAACAGMSFAALADESTTVGGKAYIDFTNIDSKTNGTKNDASGLGFDLTRFYLSIGHTFDDMWSANLTTDVTSDGIANEVYVKKAYLQAKLSDAAVVRIGSADMPWIPYVEDAYGFRYVEKTLIDRLGFGTSADWGLHLKGKFANGLVNYGFAVINGSGYKHPSVHTNAMDFEGRVNLNWNNFVLGVGGYVGKLGKDTEGATTFHTAKRLDAIAAYVDKQFRVGVEYFHATAFKDVTSVTSNKADGVSVFASYQFDPKWNVFGRYDYVKPTKSTNNSLSDNYFNVGVTYTPVKIVDLSFVYKRDKIGDGSWGTANGTIGGLTATTGSGTYDEFGLFSRLRW